MAAANKVRISTEQYQWTYSHAPRGVRYWLFCKRENYQRNDYYNHGFGFANMSYSAAKKLAQQAAAQKGITELVVCP